MATVTVTVTVTLTVVVVAVTGKVTDNVNKPHIIQALLALAVVGQCVWFGAGKDAERTALNQWPMVMCHDAATTYLGTNMVLKW